MSFNPCSFSSIEFSVFSSSGLFFSFSLFAAVVAVAAGKGKGERGNKLKTSKLLCSQAPGSVSPQQYYYSLLCAVNHSGQTALPNVFKQSSPSKEEQAEFFCSGGRSSLSLSLFLFLFLPLFFLLTFSSSREEDAIVIGVLRFSDEKKEKRVRSFGPSLKEK